MSKRFRIVFIDNSWVECTQTFTNKLNSASGFYEVTIISSSFDIESTNNKTIQISKSSIKYLLH